MARTTETPVDRRRDWKTALGAMRKLLTDPNDTVQVFKIMQALNGDRTAKNYARLVSSYEGGRIAYAREELVEKLTDREWLARFGPGTVGAAYCAFLGGTGFSADGLADVSHEIVEERDIPHPYAWFGRRERDLHDIWHTLTGYSANDPLGELCLVAFSYAQTKGLGWGFIALIGTLDNLREAHGYAVTRAVWEAWRNGRKAKWLHNEDVDALFAEPLEAARARLNIARPVAYERAQRLVSATPASWLVPTA